MIYTFDSTMPGALALSGTAGALKAIHKTYLVDGAGAGPVATLTVASGIATATYASGHPFRVSAIAQFAGATPSQLNGLKPILSVATNSVTFAAPGVADGAATGSITSKLAPAGWSELYAGTANVLAVKPSVPEATGCVLRVDDTGTTNARVRGFESMSDISTGLGPIPLDAQVSGGLYWPKSGAASSAARPWFIVADERGFYLAVSPQGTADRYVLLYAGDIASFKSGDAYNWLLTGNQSDQVALTTVPDGCCGWSHRSARGGAYLARSHTGVGGALAAQRIGSHHTGTTADVYAGIAGYAWGSYPNGPNSGLMTGALELYAQGMRGTLPGLLHAVQDCSGALTSGTTVAGTDDLAGRTLLVLRTAPPSGSVVAGTVLLDITGPWVR
jgi:hypothetical protein